MIKYQFAKNESDNLVDINEIKEIGKMGKYYYLGCGKELIPRIGKYKIPHFAHKHVCECYGESYLHNTSKMAFYNKYRECLETGTPYYLRIYHQQRCNHFESKFNFVCDLGIRIAEYDLTKYFPIIKLESKVDGFIPDVLLQSRDKNERIFIEFTVTHRSSSEKINSDNRIIEFLISNENDIKQIQENNFIPDSLTNMLNFSPKEFLGDICKGDCQCYYGLFYLDFDGRCRLIENELKKIEKFLDKESEFIAKYDLFSGYGCSPSKTFKHYVAKFYNEGAKVRNCFICRYHADNNAWIYDENTKGAPIYCKFQKLKVNSNKAVSCQYFRVDMEHVQRLLKINLHDDYYY